MNTNLQIFNVPNPGKEKEGQIEMRNTGAQKFFDATKPFTLATLDAVDVPLRDLPELCDRHRLGKHYDTMLVKAGANYAEREVARITLNREADAVNAIEMLEDLGDNPVIRRFGQFLCMPESAPRELILCVRLLDEELAPQPLFAL